MPSPQSALRAMWVVHCALQKRCVLSSNGMRMLTPLIFVLLAVRERSGW